MGILESILGSLAGAGAPQQAPQSPLGGLSPELINAVIGMLANNSQGGGGGLGDLIGRFQQGGLGDLIGSWISSGANQPVSEGQLGNVLGGDILGQLTRSTGLSQGDVLGQLTQVLPGLIDHLTPQGQAPQGGLGSMADILAQLNPR